MPEPFSQHPVSPRRWAYTERAPATTGAPTRSEIMSKVKHGNKESKKQPVMSAKEKKAAKQAKKTATDTVPFIPK
jgi:hypothetical protein